MEPSQYFASSPDVASDPKRVDVLLPDVSLTLTSDAGVFSHGSLDDATRILLETVPPPPDTGALLDLGCGYGPIALTLATRSPAAMVWAVDVNERALALTIANATAASLPNVTAARPDEVDASVRFAAIYSNPPIRIGKAALHVLLVDWLARLAPGGAAYLVVGRHLGADSLAGWLGTQGFTVSRIAARRSYRVLAVTPA